ncbi:NUDIX domain-containing protein [Paenibacillus guangzhouensis]|uniref:NUDIX domain-containing protein n=1 Tax=Paenibacillus guangzhouensis TaxID=1473112 RepID=UPI0012668F2A|nr:NUDIX domain-containing protein [Paenibacillus guangzhouensis]
MIRNTVRALIIQDDKLLLIKKKRPNIGLYYVLPGGAQESNETLEQALIRECIEELGIEISSSNLICVREYISRNHEYSFILKEVHTIDFIYECNIQFLNNELRSLKADIGQVGIEWLPINEIKKTIYEPEESLESYKFPRTTYEFFKEYFSDQLIELYSGKIFESIP